MIPLILKTIEKNYKKILVYALISVFFIWIYIAMFPQLQESAEEVMALIDSFPEGIMQAFGVNSELAFATLEGFMATEYFSILWPIIILIFVIGLGSDAIASEIDSGSIFVLLSQPMTRIKIFLSKFISHTLLITVLCLFSVLMIIPIAIIYDIEYVLNSYLLMTLFCFLFAMSIYSFTLMLSTFFSTRGKASAISSGLLIIMYALYILSHLQESVENVKYLSIFHYFDFQEVMMESNIPSTSLILFASLIIISFTIGMIRFNRRDIS